MASCRSKALLSSTASASKLTSLLILGTHRERIELATSERGRALLIGGAPLNEDIVIWWNFVAHDEAYVEHAQRDRESRADRFDTAPEARSAWNRRPFRGTLASFHGE